jgi:hypothetical protein
MENRMREQRSPITPEKLAAMIAAQARIAPLLPPDTARAIWIARLSGHYDPPVGKYAVPALALYPRDEQPAFRHTRMPGPSASRGFGNDASGALQSPFVRAAMASFAASSNRRPPAIQTICASALNEDGSSQDSVSGADPFDTVAQERGNADGEIRPGSKVPNGTYLGEKTWI